MSTAHPFPYSAPSVLPWAARSWFLAALFGQWVFAIYIGWVLAWPAVSGDFAAINRTGMITGYVPGDSTGNAALLVHLVSALVLNVIGLNGVLIVLAVVMAWRLAKQRRFAEHRRWAIRAFLLVSGVWTLRLGLMAWIILNQGPRGMTARLDGPFDSIWIFGCYLVPLAVAELYFRAERAGIHAQRAMAALLLGGAGLTALGSVGAFLLMWYPRF